MLCAAQTDGFEGTSDTFLQYRREPVSPTHHLSSCRRHTCSASCHCGCVPPAVADLLRPGGVVVLVDLMQMGDRCVACGLCCGVAVTGG